MSEKAVAIVVGGGPAPGINGVISAVTIEAINRGHRVLGIHNGFRQVCQGDDSSIRELTIDSVSRIPREGGSVLATSRANPTRSPEILDNVVQVLLKHEVGYLVTIGGDDTANSARAVSEAAGARIAVGHVPKTIDNDLPLPSSDNTFGFHTAREHGTAIVETLQVDAKTTGRWYIVVAMGRKAGHLALGIGTSAGATLTIIPEDFGGDKVHLQTLVDGIAGSIIKRQAMGRGYGVIVLAEGIAECLDHTSLPELDTVERDPHGNIRFAELDIGRIMKEAVRKRLQDFGVEIVVVDKNVGYELRCGSPVAFDRVYTQQLGYGVIDFLLNGGDGAMISRQSEKLVPIPFGDLIDPETGKTKIRMVDTASVNYQVAQKYMIRLTEADLRNDDFAQRMASVTKVDVEKLREQLGPVAARRGGYAALR